MPESGRRLRGQRRQRTHSTSRNDGRPATRLSRSHEARCDAIRNAHQGAAQQKPVRPPTHRDCRSSSSRAQVSQRSMAHSRFDATRAPQRCVLPLALRPCYARRFRWPSQRPSSNKKAPRLQDSLAVRLGGIEPPTCGLKVRSGVYALVLPFGDLALRLRSGVSARAPFGAASGCCVAPLLPQPGRMSSQASAPPSPSSTCWM